MLNNCAVLRLYLVLLWVACASGCGDEVEFPAPVIDNRSSASSLAGEDVVENSEPLVVDESAKNESSSDQASPDDDADEEDTPKKIDPPPNEEDHLIYWFWQCPQKPMPITPRDAVVLENGGDHELSRVARRANIDHAGYVCDPPEPPRDLLLTVSVSESLRNYHNKGNDPLKEETCQRYEAIASLLESVDPTTRVGLVTFDCRVRTVSEDFLEVDAFRETYLNPEILCQSGVQNNFASGFEAATDLLAKSRMDAVPEVYIFSDGERLKGPDGLAELGLIKQRASVSTIYIPVGNEDLLKDRFASEDDKGSALHGSILQTLDVYNATGLLNAVSLVDAAFRYREIGDPAWTEVPLQAGAFEIPRITMDQLAMPKGLEFELYYKDSSDSEYKDRGSLIWKAVRR